MRSDFSEKKEKDEESKKEELLSKEELNEKLKKLKKWKLSSDGKKIYRKIKYKNFRESIDFINSIASFSQQTKHYPKELSIRFKKVIIILSTKKKGVSKKDIVLAQEINAIKEWKTDFEKWLVSPKVVIILLIISLSIILWQHFS